MLGTRVTSSFLFKISAIVPLVFVLAVKGLFVAGLITPLTATPIESPVVAPDALLIENETRNDPVVGETNLLSVILKPLFIAISVKESGVLFVIVC